MSKASIYSTPSARVIFRNTSSSVGMTRRLPQPSRPLGRAEWRLGIELAKLPKSEPGGRHALNMRGNGTTFQCLPMAKVHFQHFGEFLAPCPSAVRLPRVAFI